MKVSFSLGKLFSRERSVLGIDIGASSLKIVQLRIDKERAVLETYGELATGAYESQEVGRVVNPGDERVATMIRDLIKEAEISAIGTYAALPLRYGFIKLIDLPEMPESDIASAVQFEARKYIPLPVSEVDITWDIAPTVGEEQQRQGKIPILLVALQKEMEARYGRIIANAGLQPRGFELEALSAVRSVTAGFRSGMLIVDIGAATTKISVVDRGSIRAALGAEKGGQHMTVTLAKALGVEFQRAEEMKRKSGILDRPETREIRETLLPVVDAIYQEVVRLRNFYAKSGGVIEKIILVGGGALTPGLLEYTSQYFGLEAHIGNPFQMVEYPVIMEPVAKRIAPTFSVAIGLALAGLGSA